MLLNLHLCLNCCNALFSKDVFYILCTTIKLIIHKKKSKNHLKVFFFIYEDFGNYRNWLFLPINYYLLYYLIIISYYYHNHNHIFRNTFFFLNLEKLILLTFSITMCPNLHNFLCSSLISIYQAWKYYNQAWKY